MANRVKQEHVIAGGDVAGGDIYKYFYPTFEAAINQMKPISEHKSPNPMHFLNDGIGFYGRDNEFRWLDNFRNSDGMKRYAIVHGVGGVGKSKLLYEYIKRNSDNQWHMCFLTDVIIRSLSKFSDFAYPKDLLLIIDYASRNASIIGEWLNQLATTKDPGKKIRLVLLERQGRQYDSPLEPTTPWLNDLYGDLEQKRNLKDIEYGFLLLKQIDPDCLMKMIDDYVKNINKEMIIENKEKIAIIDFVKNKLQMLPTQQSPLLVLFVADAFANGRSYREWNLELLIENYVNRLNESWLISLCKNNRTAFHALMNILVLATATGGLNVDGIIPPYFLHDFETLKNNDDCKEILEGATGITGETIAPIEPDIIGEFMVLSHLKRTLSKKIRHDIVSNFYVCPPKLMSFFDKCIDDYSDMSIFSTVFDEFIELLKPPADETVFNSVYATLIAKFALKCTGTHLAKCTNILKHIHMTESLKNTPHIINITMLYAYHLVYLTYFEDYNKFIDSVIFNEASNRAIIALSDLQSLLGKYGDENSQLILAYAQALANVSYYNSTAHNTKLCVKEISTIYEKYNKYDSELSVPYSMALNNLIRSVQKEPCEASILEAETALADLFNLYQLHVKDSDSASISAVHIINAIFDPALHSVVDQMSQEFLRTKGTYQDEIAIEYAKALNNMTGVYSIVNRKSKAVDMFNNLESFYEKNKANTEVEVEYAKGIVNVIFFYSDDIANSLIQKLKSLCTKGKDNFDILLVRYIRALCNRTAYFASEKKHSESCDWIMGEAISIYNDNNSVSPEIALFFAGCLYHMFLVFFYQSKYNDCKRLYDTIIDVHSKADAGSKQKIEEYIINIKNGFDISEGTVREF